jgi:hypothetical protein
METSQNIRKGTSSGKRIGPKPQKLTLINKDPEVRASFEQFRCMDFCRKIQGFNMRLDEQFTLNFDSFCVVIAGVIIHVTKETLLITTKIHFHEEIWFKGMSLDTQCYEDFIK